LIERHSTTSVHAIHLLSTWSIELSAGQTHARDSPNNINSAYSGITAFLARAVIVLERRKNLLINLSVDRSSNQTISGSTSYNTMYTSQKLEEAKTTSLA
jgi:hypothetical protein